MRAGAFADQRVIDLLNRRFVPFYFNRGGPGLGHDAQAQAFVADKPGNPWAYLAAYAPDGTYLGETDLYADEDAVFSHLRALLAEHPELGAMTADEREIVAAAVAPDADRAAHLAAGRLHEELGDYAAARRHYEAARAAGGDERAAKPLLSLARLRRYERDWDGAARELDRVEATADARDATIAPEIAMERAHREYAERHHAAVKTRLFAALRAHPNNRRRAEMHCYLGAARFFLDERDWARFHWIWVLANAPDDRHVMRCRIAAAAESMPYVNSLLHGYRATCGPIGPHDIVAAVAEARRIHDRLAPAFARGEWDWRPEPSAPAPSEQDATRDPGDAARRLVAGLIDGNAHRLANNDVVRRLEAIGEPAIAPLIGAIADADFAGRGYAAFALGSVLSVLGRAPESAMAALTQATRASDPYVVALATSGLRVAREPRAKPVGAVAIADEGSPLLLVAALRDSEDRRIALANEARVDRLREMGLRALDALIAASRDPAFPGRVAAVHALGGILRDLAERPPEALRALEDAAEVPGPIGRLATECLRSLPRK